MTEAVSSAPHGSTIAEALRGFTLVGGDWVLWVLIAAGALSLAVTIERLVYFTRNRTPARRFLEALTARLRNGDVRGASLLAQATKGAEARIAYAALARMADGERSVDELMTSREIAERLRFEKYLMILGTMGNNAPFFGLFGTVLGIIKAFHDLGASAGAGGGPTLVMSGISQALVATAMGLLVAIPAVVAYNYFRRKVKEFSANAEAIEHVIRAYAGDRSQPSREAPPPDAQPSEAAPSPPQWNDTVTTNG